MLGLKVQPKTAAHHALVARGSSLASSVCVIQPYNPGVGTCAGGDSVLAVFLVVRFLGILHRGDGVLPPSSTALCAAPPDHDECHRRHREGGAGDDDDASRPDALGACSKALAAHDVHDA